MLDTAYCYSVFVRTGAGWSPGRTVKARPFDSTAGQIKWAYATGGTAVAPPTVSGLGILALSNDRTVHALTRGAAGGEWPTNWMPTPLAGRPAYSRSPVVPFTVALGGATPVLFTADDAGFVHAINADSGRQAVAGPGPPPRDDRGTGLDLHEERGHPLCAHRGHARRQRRQPAARALKLADGTLLEAYTGAGSPGPIGPINGSPAIDYATRRVYFASWVRLWGATRCSASRSAAPASPPYWTWKWSRNLGNITGSPVLRGCLVYVGTDAGVVYSLDAASGGGDHTDPPRERTHQGIPVPRPAQRRLDLRHGHQGLERLRRRLLDPRSTGSGRTRGSTPR